MATKIFETIGKLGLGLAVAGGIVNSALYNGKKTMSVITFTCQLQVSAPGLVIPIWDSLVGYR